MTAEEAIKTIEVAIAEVEWEYPLDYSIAFETAIEALEKQIPKKLKDDGWLYCPICGWDVLMDKFDYCPDCGQALDWSENNA